MLKVSCASRAITVSGRYIPRTPTHHPHHVLAKREMHVCRTERRVVNQLERSKSLYFASKQGAFPFGCCRRRFLSTTTSSNFSDYDDRQCIVRGVGENWTGALGTGQLTQRVAGHNDEEEDEFEEDVPVEVFSTKFYHPDDKLSVSTGWGHSAIIDQHNTLLLAGQPHDWQKLFRYKRLPTVLQKLATNFESMPHNSFGKSLSWLMDKYNQNERAVEVAMHEQGVMKIQEGEDYLPGERQLEDTTRDDWRKAEAMAFFHEFKPISAPEPVRKVLCSAALTGALAESGKIFMFGQNDWGQCGTGRLTESNLWEPRYPVVRSIPDDIADEFHLKLASGTEDPRARIHNNPYSLQEQGENDANIPQMYPSEPEYYDPRDPFDILYAKDFALGLQHGLAVDEAGRLYCWGKGERGQLGQLSVWGDSCAALRVQKYFEVDNDGENLVGAPSYFPMEPVQQVAAGMVHSAALTYDNHIFVWGKNVLPPLPKDKEKGKKASDSKIPFKLPRDKLPDCRCLQIACGSHHTAMLFEDGSVYGIGISSDTKRPMLLEPVELISPGVIEMPVRQFAAHMDRTTIVGGDGKQILQVHLWEDPELQAYSAFTPSWVNQLFAEDPNATIEEVHRSWLHSLIVTSKPLEENDSNEDAPALDSP